MATVSLAGIALSGVAPVEWSLTSGVVPFATEILCERNSGLEIFRRAGGEATELIIGDRTFREVYVTSYTAGDDPNTIRLLVQDQRWKWASALIARSFNVRKRTGNVQRRGKDRVELQNLARDLIYFPWSLKNNRTVWTIEEALADVFSELRARVTIPNMDRQIEFQDFDVEKSGGRVVGELLAKASGYSVKPREDGSLVVHDLLDFSEEDARDLQVIVGTGWRETADRRYERPIAVEVLWTREPELRFDFQEKASIKSQVRGREPLEMENVLPIPDGELDIGGQKAATGTWVELADYIAAIGKIPLARNKTKKLTLGAVLRFYTEPAYLRELYGTTGDGTPDPAWMARIDTILTHFRRTYRINSTWLDRIRSFRPYRVAIVSPEHRSRAKAQAFQQYMNYPAFRAAIVKKKSTHRTKYGWSRDDYAANLNGATASPVDVRIVDQDNGIISLNLILSPFRDSNRIVPGIPDGTLPNLIDDARGALARLLRTHVPLDDGFRAAVILTTIQAAPNNSERFHRVRVTAKQAGALLGVSVGEARGPVLQIKVPDTPTTTARFEWSDTGSDPADIREAFYTGRRPIPIKLLSNKEHVQAISEAIAAEAYAFFQDHLEGGFETALTGFEPTGSIAAVSHVVSPDGEIRTRIDLPRPAASLDFWALVDPNIRRTVRGTVQP